MAKVRIMVVEDEAIVALDIQNKLEGLGYEVPPPCARGDEAVAQAEALRPDLVLMDIRLEGEMDGVVTAEQIRQRFNLPVVYLTAYSDESTLERAKITEPFGYLLKPFEERELHTTIEVVLYKRAAETEKTRLEERLRQARKMEAIGQLTTGMAHNFNDMLQGIIGNLDLALMSANDDLRPLLEGAVFDAERAARLVKQLMLFYRQEQGTHQPVQLRDLAEEVADRCRQVFDRRIAILVEAADLPPVLGNREQLQQLLVNLCTNSRDALEPVLGLPDRSPEIRLRLRLASASDQPSDQSTPSRCLQLSVVDNGVGMDEKTRDRMFEPFFTTKKTGQATGLSLAVVSGIVQDHQGWIECESAPGAGTTVSAFLPLAADRVLAETPAVDRALPPVQQRGAGELRGTETILVIADVDRFRSVLDLMLERHGYQSLLSRNVQDGLELFRYQHQRVDLVLLDLSTPEMSVQEVLAELRRHDPQVKTLVLTGQNPDQPTWTGAAILGKPFNTSQLLQAVRQRLTA